MEIQRIREVKKIMPWLHVCVVACVRCIWVEEASEGRRR